jgi:hypothetical protein
MGDSYSGRYRELYHTVVYLIMKSNGKFEFDLLLTYPEYGGDSFVSDYYIPCEDCSGGITTSKFVVTLYPKGFMNRGKGHISACIWIYLGHGSGDVKWNNERYVYVELPIYVDKEAKLHIIPGLLIGDVRSDAEAEAKWMQSC